MHRRSPRGRRGWTSMKCARCAQLVSAYHLVDDGPCLARQHPTARAGKKSAGTDELAGLTVPEVRRLLAIALPLPARSPEVRLAWSTFREAGSDSGPVEAITDDACSSDTLVPGLVRPHNYGCSSREPCRSKHPHMEFKKWSVVHQNTHEFK